MNDLKAVAQFGVIQAKEHSEQKVLPNFVYKSKNVTANF